MTLARDLATMGSCSNYDSFGGGGVTLATLAIVGSPAAPCDLPKVPLWRIEPSPVAATGVPFCGNFDPGSKLPDTISGNFEQISGNYA